MEDPPKSKIIDPQWLSVKFKFLTILYSAYLTRVVKAGTQDGNRVFIADTKACKEQTKLVRFCADFYHDLSTITHMWSLPLFLFLTTQISSTSTDYTYLKCYSPRFVLAHYVALQNCLVMCAMFSGCHLVYRYLVKIYRKEFEINLISFVLIDEGDFRKCLSRGGSRRAADQFEGNTKPAAQAMYYRYRNPESRKLELVLRLNRDEKTRQDIFKIVNRIFNLTLAVGLLYSLAYLLAGAAVLFMYQEELYQGCADEFWSFVRISRTLVSLLIVLVQSFDNFLFLLFTVITTLLLVYDLDKYLAKLMVKIRQVQLELSSIEANTRAIDEIAKLGRHSAAPSANLRQHRYHVYCCCGHCACLRQDQNMRQRAMNDIADVQACLVDFFGLVQQTDKYMSVVTPFSMFVWLVCNAFMTLSGIQFESSFDSMGVRLFQILGLILSGIVSGAALYFKRGTERVYVPLCTLMAMDPTVNKSRWIPVMSYYTHKPRYAFTLFGYKIYTRLTYLTYISYTLTFILFVENSRIVRPD